MKEERDNKSFNRLINHGPVILVSTARKGKPNVMTIAWHTPVSHSPPMLAVSIAPQRHSCRLIRESEDLVLNVPTVKMAKEILFCGTVSGRDIDKFRETGLTPSAAGVVKPPHIEECIGHIECQVRDEVVAGDHSLFICDVKLVVVESSLFDEVWCIEDDELLTLHHLGGIFYAPIGQRLEIKN
jgi:flavin reductase (DIM6/NTAB) family NADH-FMN oxidoreductase RutF